MSEKIIGYECDDCGVMWKTSVIPGSICPDCDSKDADPIFEKAKSMNTREKLAEEYAAKVYGEECGYLGSESFTKDDLKKAHLVGHDSRDAEVKELVEAAEVALDVLEASWPDRPATVILRDVLAKHKGASGE